MYIGNALDWQQTAEARRARWRYVAIEVLVAVATVAWTLPLFVYLLLEAIP
jgi:hypothetical protein